MRILFVTLSNIGDVVMSTTIMTRLLEQHPDAVFDSVCGKPSVGLFDDFPNKGDVIPLVKMKHHMHYGALAWKLKKRKYDLVIDLRGSLISAMVRTKKRMVFRKSKGHSVEQFAKMIQSDAAPLPKLWLDPKAPVPFERENSAFYITLAPTANWMGKQWPQKYWAEFVSITLSDVAYKNAKFIILGAPHERESIDDFIASIPEHSCIDLVGKTNLKGAITAIANSHMFVGNDSGLGHIASAVGTPVVSLFGPTKDDVYAPYGDHVEVILAPERSAAELNLEPESISRIMTDIQPKMVYDALRNLQKRLKMMQEKKKDKTYA